MEKHEIILNRIWNRQVSSRIQKFLEERNITAYSLMKELGINKSTFYMCLQGERDWNIDNLIKIADYFDISLDYLIRGDESKPKSPDEEKIRQLEEENYRLRDIISRITALTQSVEIKKNTKRKSK
ncbi:MAG: hypothetical protein AMXMBFR51_20800 [Ignavibacteriota bacterium]